MFPQTVIYTRKAARVHDYSLRSAAPLEFLTIQQCNENYLSMYRSSHSRLGSKGCFTSMALMTLHTRKNVEWNKHVRGASGAFALQSSCFTMAVAWKRSHPRHTLHVVEGWHKLARVHQQRRHLFSAQPFDNLFTASMPLKRYRRSNQTCGMLLPLYIAE